jgi:hypothetical protein
MKIKFIFFTLCYFILISCGEKTTEKALVNPEKIILPKQAENNFTAEKEAILRSLDEIADLERAGSWFQGLALRESSLYEDAGDYAGAIAAVYKELAYAYGMGLIQKEDIEVCLNNILSARSEEEVTAAINAISAFSQEQWQQASAILARLFNQLNEPDGYGSWMLLVCALEENNDDRRSVSAYKAIRARYTLFPEYWYRGARVFSGAVSAEYAENCINISPEGPFAGECRKIIAVHSGLKTEDGLSIKTKKEIESIISHSINAGNPEFLDLLLPLIGLPENPYTVYAIGALRALTSVPAFRDYFNRKALVSHSRLAERLLYISRG